MTLASDGRVRVGTPVDGRPGGRCSYQQRAGALSLQGNGVSVDAPLPEVDDRDAVERASDGPIRIARRADWGGVQGNRLKIEVRHDARGEPESARATLRPADGRREQVLVDCRFDR